MVPNWAHCSGEHLSQLYWLGKWATFERNEEIGIFWPVCGRVPKLGKWFSPGKKNFSPEKMIASDSTWKTALMKCKYLRAKALPSWSKIGYKSYRPILVFGGNWTLSIWGGFQSGHNRGKKKLLHFCLFSINETLFILYTKNWTPKVLKSKPENIFFTV